MAEISLLIDREGTYFFDIKINGAHHLKKTKGFLVIKR